MTGDTFESFREAAGFAKKFAVATEHPFAVVPVDDGWIVVASSCAMDSEDYNSPPLEDEDDAFAARSFLLEVYEREGLPAEVM